MENMLKDYNLFLPDLSDVEQKDDVMSNRIRKNYKHIKKWAKRTSSDSFRLYDRDIPAFPIAIDYYGGNLCIQFYSKNKDLLPDNLFIQSCEKSITSCFAQNLKKIVWKHRICRERNEQYEKLDKKNEHFIALENGIPFLINIDDYLDNGLFLDHRITREYVMKEAREKRVLNLFSYTSSFSVYAFCGGASETLSVDMSNKYCKWSADNFKLNNMPSQKNIVLREDCIKFLKTYSGKKFDIIVIDPPTISRSAKMENFFDVNKDYVFLITNALKHLTDNGFIMFSTNSRTIKPDFSLFNVFVNELTPSSIPFGFHDVKIHRAWIIKKKEFDK